MKGQLTKDKLADGKWHAVWEAEFSFPAGQDPGVADYGDRVLCWRPAWVRLAPDFPQGCPDRAGDVCVSTAGEDRQEELCGYCCLRFEDEDFKRLFLREDSIIPNQAACDG